MAISIDMAFSKAFAPRNTAGKRSLVVLQVVAVRQFDDQPSGLPEQAFTVRVRGHQ